MPKTPVTIHVDSDVAQALEAASSEDRRRHEDKVNIALRESISESQFSSIQAMQQGIIERLQRIGKPIDSDKEHSSQQGTQESSETGAGRPTDLDHEERLRRLRAAWGIWKDRTDFPTREEFREEWERRMNRLFGEE